MNTIIAGEPATITEQVLHNGEPLAISGDVTARVFSISGREELVSEIAVDSEADGADWGEGRVVVSLSSADTTELKPGDAMLVLQGPFGIKRFKLSVEELFSPTQTSLFIKDLVVNEMREDRLMAAAAGAVGSVTVSDEYLWDKVRAAESEISNRLRVPLVPTRYFPRDPTEQELSELDGMPYVVEPGNDYRPDMFDRDKWGTIVTRARPIIDVLSIKFSYPAEQVGFFEIPTDWVNVDRKYGVVRIVPTSNALITSINGMMLTAVARGRTIPSMIRMVYDAGLEDIENNYPELINLIKKLAVLKVIGDAFLPQSGSLSSDGHSQSISIDMEKYHDEIELALNGPKGSNGGLMARIHGIRMHVV